MTLLIDYKFHTSLLRNPNMFKYEIFSFIKIVSSYFGLTQFHEDCILYRLNETWNDRTILYNKIRYENVILGLMLFCNEFDCKNNEQILIEPFITSMYPQEIRQENLISIFKVYQTSIAIFNVSQLGSNTSSISGSTGINR